MRRIAWTAKDCLRGLLVVAVVMLILKGFLEMWASILSIEDPMSMLNSQPLFWMATYLLQILALVFGIVWVVPKWSFKKLGFRKVAILKGLGLVVLVFLVNIGVNAFYVYLNSYFGVEIPGYQQQLPHIPLFGKTVFGVISLFVLAVIAAPLIEELFFRGFLLQGLLKRFGKWGAILLSGVAFSVIHFEFQNIIPLFILSLLLGWMFVESDSLWPPIAFHAFNNTLALVVELLVY